MLLTLIAQREVSFDSKRDGRKIEGNMIGAITEAGDIIEFWSQRDFRGVIVQSMKFDKLKATEIDLELRVDSGRIKYRERD